MVAVMNSIRLSATHPRILLMRVAMVREHWPGPCYGKTHARNMHVLRSCANVMRTPAKAMRTATLNRSWGALGRDLDPGARNTQIDVMVEPAHVQVPRFMKTDSKRQKFVLARPQLTKLILRRSRDSGDSAV